MTSLLDATPESFVDELLRHNIHRVYLVPDARTGSIAASHPFVQPLASFFDDPGSGYAGHEAVFLAIGPETHALFGAFVHTTTRGMAQGGLRHVPYESIAAFLRDGLRLSHAMARKSALAGLWWGGGKGVIARQPGDAWHDRAYRDTLYHEYGQFVTSLRGCFVAAEDAGTNVDDMAAVFRATRFATCIPPALGGSGNPSVITARGVVVAMEAALDHLGRGTLEGKRVAIEGLGNVGGPMVGFLLERGVASVVAADIAPDRVQAIRERHAGQPVEARLVGPGNHDVLAEPCDIVAPNGLGGVLNAETIPRIQAPIVCGAANNQLDDETRDAAALRDRGITFVPDFVCNRMGIVNCANEQYGYPVPDPAIERHLGREWEHGIYQATRRVLTLAATEGITTNEAATTLADALAREPHPIWPGRGREIVRTLVGEGWATGE
ncbi:MAG: branched-chain amino acid dehydrogenase [Dehalococcoidia bacterium]